MPLLETLHYWRDETPRSGAENMAVDQLLMETVGDVPILRIYEWSEPTVTFGYFLPLTDAKDSFSDPELTYIRRWTGGGVVDHRSDITYTLIIPRNHELATARGAESYCLIHKAVAEAMKNVGDAVRITSQDEGDGSPACFINPVAFDLTDMSGDKVAGAGQRRSRYGMLHQGSVICKAGIDAFSKKLVESLTASPTPWQPPQELLDDSAGLAQTRYTTSEWLNKKR